MRRKGHGWQANCCAGCGWRAYCYKVEDGLKETGFCLLSGELWDLGALSTDYVLWGVDSVFCDCTDLG